MNKLYLVILLLCIQELSAQPAFQWARRGIGSTTDDLHAMVTDGDGNTYITGTSGTGGIIFGVDTLSSANGATFYLAKYDALGNENWARGAGGPGGEAGWGIDLDNQGNIYVCGSFTQSGLTFGTTALVNNGSGTYDIFIVKYDSSGNVLWAFSEGGTDNDYAFGIKVDPSGYFHITGSYFSPVIIFGGTTALTNTNIYSDVYVAKYTINGNFLWAQTAQDASGLAIDIGPNGESYFTGKFVGQSIPFGNDTLTTAGDNDFYIAKLDVSGNFLWAQRAGSFGTESGQGIAVDASGNCFATGHFRTPITFGTQQLFNTGGLNSDVFVVKYSPTGNISWARRMGSNSTEESMGMRLDANSNVYIVGFMGNQPLLFAGATLNSSGNDDGLVLKYDSSGNEVWAINGGGTSQDDGRSLGLDNYGGLYFAGTYYSQPATFGNDVLPNSGGRDVYLAKVDITTGLPPGPFEKSDLIVFPIPATETLCVRSKNELKKVTLSSISGQIVSFTSPFSNETVIDIQALPAGIYFLKTETGDYWSVRKVLVE